MNQAPGAAAPRADGASVVVVGSVTTDVTAFARRLPRPHETVIGDNVTLVLGGKGANQAVAAARYGAPTWMVGCVGDDPFAELCARQLADHGVALDLLRRVEGPTGVAHIRVDAEGTNDIVITPLANNKLDTPQVDAALAKAAPGSVLLLQLEIRPEITAYAARVGRRAGLTVVLDPAPAAPLPEEIWADVDIVTPNESEIEALTGLRVTTADEAARAADWFLKRGVRQVIVTLGAAGVVSVTAEGRSELPAFPMTAVDTTAAGDAFTGTFGAALALGLDPAEAIRHGTAAGAITVTRPGASPSIPSREEVMALLASR
jgi:ribokinase